MKNLLIASTVSKRSILDAANHNCRISFISRPTGREDFHPVPAYAGACQLVVELTKATTGRVLVVAQTDQHQFWCWSHRSDSDPASQAFPLTERELVEFFGALSPTTRRVLVGLVTLDPCQLAGIENVTLPMRQGDAPVTLADGKVVVTPEGVTVYSARRRSQLSGDGTF